MNYYSHYQSNPLFPYQKKTIHRPNTHSSASCNEITRKKASPPPKQEKADKTENAAVS